MKHASRRARRALALPALAVSCLLIAVVAVGAADYAVGPGDKLMISIRSGSTESGTDQELQVGSDGTVDVVHVGPMTVAGLTTSAIRSEVSNQLKAKKVFVNASVSVNILEYGSQPVNVAGAVKEPKRLFLTGPTLLRDVIAEAGGIDAERAGWKIRVTRRGRGAPILLKRSDLYGTDESRIGGANIRMRAHDDVFVSEKERFCISGAVVSPDCYELEEVTSLLTALALAGGLDETTANRSSITVWRSRPSEEKLVVNLDDVEAGRVQPPRIVADDQIVVATGLKPKFCISGAVIKPDCYEIEGATSLLTALALAGGLDEATANRSQITIWRSRPAEEKLVINMEDVEAGKVQPPRIVADDQIVVARGMVSKFCISGRPVKHPDCYDHVSGLTVGGAIEMAGGLDEMLADLHHVTLRRKLGEEDREFQLDLARGSDAAFRVERGDEILVGEVQLKVTVEGSVVEPGAKDWWSGMTIADAIAEAKGAEGETFGNLKKTMLRRANQPARPVNVKAIQKGAAPDVPLEPGDKIYVPPKRFGW